MGIYPLLISCRPPVPRLAITPNGGSCLQAACNRRSSRITVAGLQAPVGTNPGPTWHVKGSGDFNGDNHADILWQNDNGTVVTWLIDAAGTGTIGGAVIGTNPGPTWH